jgi:hypothetical protein
MMIERYCIGASINSSGLQKVSAVGMPVAHLAREHVDELDAGMAEIGIRLPIALERDQKRLNPDFAGQRMPKQIVQMARLGAAALDAHALPGFDKRAIATLFGFGKQTAHRDIEGLRQRAQGRQRWRNRAVFDLREHAGADAGVHPELGDRQIHRPAETAHLCADFLFDAERSLVGRGQRPGQQVLIARFARGNARGASDRLVEPLGARPLRHLSCLFFSGQIHTIQELGDTSKSRQPAVYSFLTGKLFSS